ncbi:hypothetical protein ACFL0D_05235 [Thermoproteota archaeon]
MKAKPYVGITGLTTSNEVKAVVKLFQEFGYTLDSPHIPMMGFLIDYRFIKGMSKLNMRYPDFKDLTEILQAADNKVFTMIHYTMYGMESKIMHTLAEQVTQVFEGIYDDHCKSVQFNIGWPNAEQVEIIKDKFPEMQIVLQLLDRMSDNKKGELVERIKKLDNLDYILIDPSAGKQVEFDIDRSLHQYFVLKDKFPSITLGFAGGLTGENLARKIKKIIEKTGDSNFCIDAEGGLRTQIGEEFAYDVLDMKKVRCYLKAASSVLK